VPLTASLGSIAVYQSMRIAVEVLGREFVQFRIFKRFHLMDQARRYVHALPWLHLEFVDYVGINGLFNPDLESARTKKERFSLELMEVKRTFPALANFQDLAAI
jgi:hypothetical protein